jgi:hypothetical protein
MLVTPIRRFEIRRSIAILLLAGGLVSCASQEPKPAALVGGDSNAPGESSIPWNKPQGWESTAGLPLGLSGSDGSTNPNNPAGY